MVGAGQFLTIDQSQIEAISTALAATPKEAEKAMARALNRTAQWMQTRARRALAAGLNIPSKVIRARLRYALYNKSTERVRVWFGLNPVSAIRLKNPRQNATGVKAGGEQYDGAFIATGRNGNRHIYERVGKRRFPIVSVYKEIEEGASILERQVFEGWEDFFFQRFEHELVWEGKKK
jgi:hypothetical protein